LYAYKRLEPKIPQSKKAQMNTIKNEHNVNFNSDDNYNVGSNNNNIISSKIIIQNGSEHGLSD